MRNTVLRLAALSLVALVLFAPTAAAQGKTTTVSIKNFAFNPPNATVAPGTTVTWVNNDQTAHTVTANDGAFDSGTLQPGQSYSFVFDKPGTYAYHCNIHPYMTATVTVSGASGSASGCQPHRQRLPQRLSQRLCQRLPQRLRQSHRQRLLKRYC